MFAVQNSEQPKPLQFIHRGSERLHRGHKFLNFSLTNAIVRYAGDHGASVWKANFAGALILCQPGREVNGPHPHAHTIRKLLIHLRSDRILYLSAPHLSMTLLNSLNERQREAVLTTEGPLLVLAGAGTGKTRVITYRVAHLIELGVPSYAILAVTFTNKAAGVMKERIGELLRSTGRDASDVWVSTFHSFCARLIRRESQHLGLPRDFAIYDDDDQTAAVKRALAQLEL